MFTGYCQAQHISNKYLLYRDTGFVIYIQPHFTGLFLSSSDNSLKNTLAKNASINYFRLYNEDFKRFIVQNDSLPQFINNDKDILIYNFGKLDQIAINYFRAEVIVKIPLEHFRYIKPSPSKKTKYYLFDKATKKITYLHEFIKEYMTVLDCIDYKLME